MTTETQEKVTTNVQLTLPQTCQAHHWNIEAPNGAESKGVCKHCKQERMFRNSLRVDEIKYDISTSLEKRYPHMIR